MSHPVFSQPVRAVGRAGAVAVALAALTVVAVVPARPAAAAAPAYTVTAVRIPVVVGPAGDQHCSVDGDVYVPASASAAAPAPAVLTTNGFGGSKADQAVLGRALASRGYEVLSYSGLGFGASGCNIELDDRDWDGKAASQLVTWLAQRPEVLSDGPGDPRVGMIGGSYGGEVQFAAAAVDSRIDALIPFITWNDLSYSLAPNNLLPRAGQGLPPGVPKTEWTELFFGVGATQPLEHPATTPVPPSTCPGFDPRVCPSNATTAALGYPDAATQALLKHASVASFVERVKAPTMLLQGEADTLFNLNEAVATFSALKDNGVDTKLVFQSWGHSHSAPAAGEVDYSDPAKGYETQLVMSWFDHYLKRNGAATGLAVEYFRPWVTYSGTAQPAYGQASALPVGQVQKWSLSGRSDLVPPGTRPAPGSAQMVNPPGGQPASYSETSAFQDRSPFSSIPPTDPPGQSVRFTTPVLPNDLDVVGVPVAELYVSALLPPAADPATGIVLFVKLYDVGPDGSVELPQRLVAPVRLMDLSRPVRVQLAGLVHRFAKGHRLALVVSTTDQAYGGSRLANVIDVSTDPVKASTLSVPLEGQTQVLANQLTRTPASAAVAQPAPEVARSSPSLSTPSGQLPKTGGNSAAALAGAAALALAVLLRRTSRTTWPTA